MDPISISQKSQNENAGFSCYWVSTKKFRCNFLRRWGFHVYSPKSSNALFIIYCKFVPQTFWTGLKSGRKFPTTMETFAWDNWKTGRTEKLPPKKTRKVRYLKFQYWIRKKKKLCLPFLWKLSKTFITHWNENSFADIYTQYFLQRKKRKIYKLTF